VSVHALAGERVSEARTTVLHSGSSVHPVRQTGPHPHAVCFSPDGRFLLVPDLGLDRIVIYPFDAKTGTLGPSHRVETPPGSGPRLILFSADGRHAVMVEELACRVVCYRWEDGTLREAAALETTGVRPNTAAGLRWHPSGATFAASNRGADTVQLFRFEAATGALAPLATVPSGGTKPRDFDFSPCGRFLVIAHQDSDSLVRHRLNEDASEAAPTGERLAVGSPTCVRFL
jgi:6-phosphogluconolactonase